MTARLEPVIQCRIHRGAWYPKSAGCSLCRAHTVRLAEQVGHEAAKAAAAARAEAATLDELAADLEAMARIRQLKSANDLIAAAFFRAFMVIALLATLAACGHEEEQAPELAAAGFGVVLNKSTLPRSTLADLVDLQLGETPELDVGGVLFIIVATLEDAMARCGVGAWACTSPSEVVIAPWDLTPSNWPASLGTVWQNAAGISHELCHCFYFQGGGDGDPTHQHQECFGETGDAVVARVAGDFVATYGDALLAEFAAQKIDNGPTAGASALAVRGADAMHGQVHGAVGPASMVLP